MRTVPAIIWILTSLSVGAAAQDAVWTELPALPTAVGNNAVASVAHADGTTTLYSFMGIVDPTDPASITPAAYALTYPGETEWNRIADAPLLNGRAKIAANAIVCGGAVYLIGGYTVNENGTETTEERLFRYDPVGDAFVQRADVPVEVDDTVVACFGDRYLYLISGWHGPQLRNVRNVQLYDTQMDTWQQCTEIVGPARFGHAGGIIGDTLVYFDGARSRPGFPISDRVFIGRIDPQQTGELTEIAWEELPAHPGLPTYRAAATPAAAIDDMLLVTGGTDNPYNYDGDGYNGQPSQPLEQLLAFHLPTRQWRGLEAVGAHVATMDHRALVRVGRGFATIGGMTGPGVATDRVYLLQLRTRPFGPPPDEAETPAVGRGLGAGDGRSISAPAPAAGDSRRRGRPVGGDRCGSSCRRGSGWVVR